MKIFTNIQPGRVGGIGQTLSSFIRFITEEKKSQATITGMQITHAPVSSEFQKTSEGKYSLISTKVGAPLLKDVILNVSNIDEMKRIYEPIIDAFSRALKQEKPDLILVNSTYYVPWCLLLAAKQTNIPTAVHYHGSLTKETENWNKTPRSVFKQMEQCFDESGIFYVFPSALAKNVVEKEVFGHAIKRSSILPNPVPDEFFQITPKKKEGDIGIVGRWTRIKNTSFFRKLARYNEKKGGLFRINIVSDLKRNSEERSKLQNLVHFRDPMGREKLSQFYAKTGVVISPSHFETYGNVAKEALASGTPALVNENMGVAETFRKLGLHDWIIKYDSVKDVYQKISETNGQVVSQSVRNAMKEEYSGKVIHGQMMKILESV
jgi:glycosyltransferase involved in cell wall biosynthesis